jgi:hypothetical protein
MNRPFPRFEYALLLAATTVLASSAAADPLFEWADVFDAGAQQSDAGGVALADAVGNLVVAGESHDGVGGADMLIRKLDRGTGGTLWTRRVSADDGNDMLVAAIAWDGDGNLLVGGTRQGCYG